MTVEKPADIGNLLTQAKITNRLLVAQLKQQQLSQIDLITQLASVGATAKEIAETIDTTPGTVQVALSRMKKKTNKPNTQKK